MKPLQKPMEHSKHYPLDESLYNNSTPLSDCYVSNRVTHMPQDLLVPRPYLVISSDHSTDRDRQQ